MLKEMKEGSVVVDVAVDQGGCFETTRPTTHSDPVYTVEGVVHYCVANMPGAVPRTSTFALTNATLPYALALANQGVGSGADDPASPGRQHLPGAHHLPPGGRVAGAACHDLDGAALAGRAPGVESKVLR